MTAALQAPFLQFLHRPRGNQLTHHGLDFTDTAQQILEKDPACQAYFDSVISSDMEGNIELDGREPFLQSEKTRLLCRQEVQAIVSYRQHMEW